MSSVRDHREARARASRSAALQERNLRRPARLGSQTTQEAPAEAPNGQTPVPERKKRSYGWLQWLLLPLQLALLGAVVFAVFRLRQQAVPEQLELRYLVPGREDIVETVTWGDPVVLHEPVELEGYTFLCWEDADGKPETREAFPLYRDRYYIARYALKLETEAHIPYLSVDRNGVFDVDAGVTVRDAVQALYLLLNLDRVGESRFADVAEDDPCFKAAATLKDLGVLSGRQLYPDGLVTRAELLKMFCSFQPLTEERFSFRDLSPEDPLLPLFSTAASLGWIDSGPEVDAKPEATFTRGEFAHAVNRILGRSPLSRPQEAEVGTILDASPSNPYYDDIIEAVIPHEYVLQDGQEHWTGSSPLPVHSPGTFFAGPRMYCIREDGRPLRDTTVDGRYFNRNGELSTGDAELDRLLWRFLDGCVEPSLMTQDEMLPILYAAVWSTLRPSTGYVYEKNTDSWVIPEAKRALTEGKASSYGFAAVFYELCYLIDVQDVRPVSGMVYGNQTEYLSADGSTVEVPAGYTPHGWVEITYSGISYIFDPESDALSGGRNMMYRKNEPIRWQAGYRTW